MQQQQDELNRAQDFDLDAYLDEIEPTHRTQTVNTAGHLLAKYGQLQQEHDELLRALNQLADSLPEAENPDVAATLSDGSEDAARGKFDALKTDLERVGSAMTEIAEEYARNKARFTFKAPDKSTRARVASEASQQGHKGASATGEDVTLALMRASITEIVVIRDGREIPQQISRWNLVVFGKFLNKIGDGQARLLVDAYLGLASGEVTPPFSQES